MGKSIKSFLGLGLGIIAAIGSSLCCIGPIITIVASSSVALGAFTWLVNLRPLLFGLSIVGLSYAWYQNIRQQHKDSCGCERNKTSFFQSKTLLAIVTICTLISMTYSFISPFFVRVSKNNTTISSTKNIQKIKLEINGMTCTSCEQHISAELAAVNGVITSNVSYKNKIALITFDDKKTNIINITQSINSIGYLVTAVK